MTCKSCGHVRSVNCVCGKTLYDAKGLKYSMSKGGEVRCHKCGREYNVKSIIACKQKEVNLTDEHVTRIV